MNDGEGVKDKAISILTREILGLATEDGEGGEEGLEGEGDRANDRGIGMGAKDLKRRREAGVRCGGRARYFYSEGWIGDMIFQEGVAWNRIRHGALHK